MPVLHKLEEYIDITAADIGEDERGLSSARLTQASMSSSAATFIGGNMFVTGQPYRYGTGEEL